MIKVRLPDKQKVFDVVCRIHDNRFTRRVYAEIVDKEVEELTPNEAIRLISDAIEIACEGYYERKAHPIAQGFILIWLQDIFHEDSAFVEQAKILCQVTIMKLMNNLEL